MATDSIEQWAILELLGHIRTAGYVTEEQHFGATVGRIDIPQADGSLVTQWFGGGAVFRCTPTTEEVARAVAVSSNSSRPVQRWELPQLAAGRADDDDEY